MELITNDEAALRRPALPVGLKRGRRTARELLRWAERHWRSHAPLGLAAPQFGIPERVCVVLAGPVTSLINPRVVARSRHTVVAPEGCLSFPGREVRCRRRVWVDVEADNLPGAALRFGPEGGDDAPLAGWTDENLLASRACQHEVAHLAGLLIFDFGGGDPPDPLGWFGEG